LIGDPTVQIRCSVTLVNPGVVRKIFLKKDTMFWYVSAQLGRSRCWDYRLEFGMAHMRASSSWSEFSLSDSFPTPHDCAGLSARYLKLGPFSSVAHDGGPIHLGQSSLNAFQNGNSVL
ncbi:hypothetical protein T07_2214, partial [Trichinella nelsoni]